jgi:hypothetical protein
MVEVFAKTFKRDYVGCNVYPGARIDLKSAFAWIEDCSENAPHKDLRMRSPKEFIRLLPTAENPVY